MNLNDKQLADMGAADAVALLEADALRGRIEEILAPAVDARAPYAKVMIGKIVEEVVSAAKSIAGRSGESAPPPSAAKSPGAYLELHRCFICTDPFRRGEMVLPDAIEGLGHRSCFGEDRSGYVKDLDTSEPLGPDDEIPAGEPYDPADYPEFVALEAMPPPPPAETFQARVQPWMLACFNAEIAADIVERCDRFIEEDLELVQALRWPKDRAHALVDYVYGRPIGEPKQEVGGVKVTLAALCLAIGVDMHEAGEVELARVWTKIDEIRAKQAAKPRGSALPIAALAAAGGGDRG